MCERSPKLSSVQLSLVPLPHNDFPTDSHRSLPSEADLSLTICEVKERFPLQSSGENPALVVSFQTTPSPVSAFLGFLFPLVVFLSLHSLSVLLIVLHVSAD